MPGVTFAPLSGDPNIDGILSDERWAVSNLTFSFPASGSFYGTRYGSGENTTNFRLLNTEQQNAVRAVLGMYSSVASISFTEVVENSSRHADLRYAMSDDPSTAHAYLPNPVPEGGDSWYRYSGGTYSSPLQGNYAFATFLHETGHALGFDHAHDGRAVVPQQHDTVEYTVMSYRSYVGASTTGGYTNEANGFPSSLMIYDIAAIQHLYGANFATNSGATTYTWSPATGELFINSFGNGAPAGNRIFQTIWDGGGNDTYDFGNYSTNLTISLEPGEWTTTSNNQLARLHYDGSRLAAGSIANALLYHGDTRSLIENAYGGSGNDSIRGNLAANTLIGRDGNDALFGREGHDRLLGGAGADELFGGTGQDTFVFRNPNDGPDQIRDFLASNDTIELDRAGFGFGASGSLADAGVSFQVGAQASGAAPTLLWEQISGRLIYDSNGSANGGTSLLATVFGERASTNVDESWDLVGTGDFNANGHDDLFWRNSSGALVIWRVVGNERQDGVSLGNVDNDWTAASIGDFNGDGDDDILWYNERSGDLLIWMMQNYQKSAGFGLVSVDLSWRVEGTGDFNGDGTADILFRNRNSDEALIWTLQDGVKQNGFGLGFIDKSWNVAGTGDFNGDGTSDIAFRNLETDQLLLWRMQGGQKVNGFSLGIVDQSWSICGIGDTNNDGSADVLWFDDNSGTVLRWVVSDFNKARGDLSASAGPDWNVIGFGDTNNNDVTDLIWRHVHGDTAIVQFDSWNQANLRADDFVVA